MRKRWVTWVLGLAVAFAAGIFILAEYTSFPERWRGEPPGIVQPGSDSNAGQGGQVSPDPEDKPEPVDEQNTKEPLPQEAFSWWFRRQPNHQPPTVEPAYRKLMQGRGFWLGDTSKKRIYLTMDNGYEYGLTGQFLDTLKAHQVKTIFFVTGSYVDKNPELVKRMAAEGHLIGNHSLSHPSFPKLSDEQKKREIQGLDEKVYQLTGQKPRYFRAPSGEFDDRTLRVAQETGHKTIFWSLAYRDWEVDKQPGKEAAYRQVIDNVHNGAIILMHTVSESNNQALGDILTTLKEQGYTFGTLDELK